MNSIFKDDTELVKAICSKKVYPNVKHEVADIVKKSAVQPPISKENMNLATKTDKAVENIVSPKVFA